MRPITAADLMNPEILTVGEDMPVEELARFLIANDISGAPVAGLDGRLVGVVSLHDIVAYVIDDEEDEEAVDEAAATVPGAAEPPALPTPTAGEAGAEAPGEVAGGDGAEDDGGGDRGGDGGGGSNGAGDDAAGLNAAGGSGAGDDAAGDDADLELLGEELVVEDIMTPKVVSVSEDATVPEIAALMLKEHLHRLLVTHDGEPRGIISTSDLLGLLIEEE